MKIQTASPVRRRPRRGLPTGAPAPVLLRGPLHKTKRLQPIGLLGLLGRIGRIGRRRDVGRAAGRRRL
jgi:hypothetical protein